MGKSPPSNLSAFLIKPELWNAEKGREGAGAVRLVTAQDRFSYHQLNWRIQAVPACSEQQSVRGARFLSLLLPPTSISSVPVSALPHASNLCTWTAFLNSSMWVLAEWKPDGPAVPTVISPPALASLPFSLLSWHGRNICLYLGGLGLTAVPLSLCCNMSWKAIYSLVAEVGWGECKMNSAIKEAINISRWVFIVLYNKLMAYWR